MSTGVGLQDVADLSTPEPKEPPPPNPADVAGAYDAGSRLSQQQDPLNFGALQPRPLLGVPPPPASTLGSTPTINFDRPPGPSESFTPSVGPVSFADRIGATSPDPLGLGQLEAQRPLARRQVVPTLAPIGFESQQTSPQFPLDVRSGPELASIIHRAHPEADPQRVKIIIDYVLSQPDPERALRGIIEPAFDPFTAGAEAVNSVLAPLGNASEWALRNTSLTGGKLGEQVGIPNVTLENAIGHLPEHVGSVPVKGPAEAGLSFAGQSLPYVAAPEALTPAFVAQAGLQATAISDRYAAGEISGRDALTELGMNVGPFLIAPALHAAGAGAEALGAFHDSPAGQAIVAKLASERGSIDMGVFDDIERTAQSQAADYSGVLKTDKTLTPEEKASFKHEALVAEQKLAAVAEARGEAKFAPGEEEHVTIPMLQTQLDAVETELQRRAIPFGGRAAMPAWRARKIERFGSPGEKARISRSFSEDTPVLEARKQALQEIIDELHTNTVEGTGPQQPQQSRFTPTGETVAEPLLAGDKGQQGDLLGAPAQTGEGLTTESAGPLFAGQQPPSLGGARTGEPFSATLYRGESDLGPRTRPGVTPARGRFFTADENTARGYAGQGSVAQETVRLDNPLVADGRDEAAQVLGVDTANVRDIRRVDELLAQAARAQGHDGIVYPRLNELQDLGAVGRTPQEPAGVPLGASGTEPSIGSPEQAPALNGLAEPALATGGEGAPPPKQPATPGASGGPPENPVHALADAIRRAKELSPEQKAMISRQKAQRVAAAKSILAKGGPDAFERSRAMLAGEYDKPAFAAPAITPEGVKSIVERIRTATHVEYFTQIRAERGLAKAMMGVKPQDAELAALERTLNVPRERRIKLTKDLSGEARGLEGEKQIFPETPVPEQGTLQPKPGAPVAEPPVPVGPVAQQGKLAGEPVPPEPMEQPKGRAAQPGLENDGTKLVAAILSKRNLSQKAFEEAIGAMGLPQAFTASFDLSAPLRQGAILGASHPRAWISTWLPMVRAAQSPEVALDIDHAIRTSHWTVGGGEHAGYGFLDPQIGGHLADLSRFAGEHEPQFAALNRGFISRFVQKFPGIQQSERGFVTMLNKLRANVYADEAQRLWDAGERDIGQYKAIASVINHATGWGDFNVGQITKGMNAFFAPRNLVARFQVVSDPFIQPGSLLKPSARQLAAKNLVAFAGVNMGVLGLVKWSGAADVNLDPRSTDFAKIRVGNTRVDTLAGYSPMVRLVYQLGTGEHMTATGNITDADRRGLVLGFLRGKLGPVPSFVTDLATHQQNMVGEPVDLTSAKGLRTQAYNRLVPFFAQDVTDAARSGGLTGAAVAIPGAFGAGIQTYANPSRDLLAAQDRAAKAAGYTDFADAQAKLGGPAAKALFATNTDVKAAQGALDANPSPFKLAVAATESDYAANDARLEAKQISGQQWRDQKKIIDASKARGIVDALKASGNADKPTGDPVLDGYYKVFRDYTNPDSGVVQDPTALNDALDAYQAGLSPEEQARLDANTGTGPATPTMARYRVVTKGLAAAGWFDVGKKVYEDGGLTQYAPDINGFVLKYGKAPPRYAAAVTKQRLALFAQLPPNLQQGALKFGFTTSTKAKALAGSQ